MREIKRAPIELPDDLFRYRSGVEEVALEQKKGTIIERMEMYGGLKVFLEGASFGQKGIASPDALFLINLTKRMVVVFIRIATKWFFIPGFLVVLFSNKKRNWLLQTFNDVAFRPVKGHILKIENQKPVARELEWFIFRFLENIGIETPIAVTTSELVAVGFDYDTPYQLILEDIMSETNKENLIKNPRREIKYLISVLKERTIYGSFFKKLSSVGYVLSALLLLPKYKKAFIKSISEIDITKMQYDMEDKYWAMLRDDGYNYMGMTYQERNKRRKELGWKKAKLIDIQ